MKTIIRLFIETVFMVLPFVTTAQERIINPEWFKHLLGKTLDEMDSTVFKMILSNGAMKVIIVGFLTWPDIQYVKATTKENTHYFMKRIPILRKVKLRSPR